MNTVLIFCDFYLPGFKAGGPITSLSFLVESITGQCRVFVVTTDRDYLEAIPYEGVELQGYHDVGGCKIRYLNRKCTTIFDIARIVAEIVPDSIYLNSVFSYSFSIRILLGRRLGMVRAARWVLCPRGELNAPAMLRNFWRKRLFLTFFRLIDGYRGLVWQATNCHELSRIRNVIGRDVEVVKVKNFSRTPDEFDTPRLREKTAGCLRIIFVGRINPHKNLLFLLNTLANLEGNIELRIYGPIDDQRYWTACTRVISELSTKIHVDYAGARDHEVVIEAMRWAHVLALPSRSENFGQVIFEALSVGTPVIISDKTPWRGLVDKGVGWDCEIDSFENFSHALMSMISMDEKSWWNMVTNSKNYARSAISQRQVTEDTMKMLFNY